VFNVFELYLEIFPNKSLTIK